MALMIFSTAVSAQEEKVQLGISNIRCSNPSSTLNWLEITLPGLISSRLSQEPDIIIQHQQGTPRRRQGMALPILFPASAVFLEADIEEIPFLDTKSRAIYVQNFSLNLRLKKVDNTLIEEHKINGITEELPQLIETIAVWLVKIVAGSSPKGSWDINKEAALFLKEGQALMANGDYASARPLLEMSCLLNPDDKASFEALTGVLYKHLEPPFDLLKRAQAAYRLIELCSRELERKDKPEEALDKSLKALEYLNKRDSAATGEIALFNKATRRNCDELLNQACHPRYGISQPKRIIFSIQWTSAVSETPKEAMARMGNIINKLLLLYAKGGYKISKEVQLQILCSSFTNYDQYHPLKAGHLDGKEVLDLWLTLLNDLAASNEVTVKIIARLGLASTFRYMSESKEEKELYSQLSRQHMDQGIDILIKELDYPDEPLPSEEKKVVREAISSEMGKDDYQYAPEVWLTRFEKIFGPLIDKNDTENFGLWEPSKFFEGAVDIECDPVTRTKILKELDRTINAMEAMDADRYRSQLSSLKDIRKEFSKKTPEKKEKSTSKDKKEEESTDISPVAEIKVNVLCDITEYITEARFKKTESYMKQPIRKGNMLWVPFIEQGWRPQAGIIGINLETQSLYSLWQASLPFAIRTKQISEATMLTSGITLPAIDEDAIYLGVWGKGIAKFPGPGRKGIEYFRNIDFITEKDGLPSNKISGIACAGKRLFVSIGCEETESYFGIYDLEKKEWQTISSSNSKEKACPLNNGYPYETGSLTLTPDGKELFFICEQWRKQSNPDELRGLWKMDIESGRMEHIWSAGTDHFHNIIPGEEKWWIRGWDSLISFEPYLETGEVIVCESQYTCIKSKDPAREAPSMGNAYITGAPFRGIHSAFFKDVFWALAEKGAQSIPCCIFVGKGEVKKFRIHISGEDRITNFFPTPFGVVVMGRYKIGLIEENPQ